MKIILFFIILMAEMIFSVFQFEFYFGNGEAFTILLYIISYFGTWVYCERFRKFRTAEKREDFLMFGTLKIFGVLILIFFILKLILFSRI